MNLYDNLTLEQRQAANKTFAKSSIEGGTATNDRLLFWDGFAAGIDYATKSTNSLPIAPPESIAQHAAVNALRAMSPQEALEWIETAYRLRSEANQRELQGVMGD